MEYRIGGIGSTKPQAYSHNREIARISREVYETIREKTKVLWDFSTPHLAWVALSKNKRQLGKLLAPSNPELTVADRVYLSGVESRERQVECLCIIMNILASASSYLSISGTHIKNNFDEGVLLNWDKKRRELHKNNFSYRFCYELRNYAQHYGLPVSEFNFEMSDTHLIKLIPIISSDDLSRNESKLNKNLFLEIMSRHPERFDLVELICGYFSCVTEIHRNTFLCYKSRFDECEEYLSNLDRLYRFESGERPVIFIRPPNGNSNQDEMEYIPTYLLSEIKEYVGNFN